MNKSVTITLRPIDQANRETCANLMVSDDQKDNLPDNRTSIDELANYPKTKAAAIVNKENQIVGFTTYGIPEGEKHPKIFRLMIDKKYQNKGYGKAALNQIIKELFSNSSTERIQVCYRPKNTSLKHFYASVGFVERGLMPDKNRTEGKMLATLDRDDFKF